MNNNPYRYANALVFVAVIAVNALAQLLPINGLTTGELSARYPVMITPAGYVFSIWSLIYLLLAAFIVYQWRKPTRSRDTVELIGPWFILNGMLNIAWIFAWHYEYVTASVTIMLALLLSLIAIYTRIRRSTQPPTTGEKLCVYLPFSIYMGWISVATIVNITVWLYDKGWDGFGLSGEAWTVILLIIGTLLAIVIGFTFHDPAFMLVFTWAFVGIAVKQQEGPPVVYWAALIAAAAILLLALLLLLTRRPFTAASRQP